MSFRAGFVSFVGRPNVGKSTLMNAIVGEKVAITSSKPQTTRHAIRGIVHRDAGQLIIVDTPGIHRPRTLLGQRLNDVVSATLHDVDVIALCIPATEKVGPGDRFIAQSLERYPRAKKIALVTKTDAASKSEIAQRLMEVNELGQWETIIPVSGLLGDQLEIVVEEILALMPESEPLYSLEDSTEQSLEVRIQELIREATLEGVSDELPHSIAVTIDEMGEREDGLMQIFANLWVERDSQKGIMIGKGGQKLKGIGQLARTGIQELMGRPVYLSLQVKVSKEWQRDPKKLDKLGL
ncbi:MAG: GTPase Era [Microbacteriaceae bacterium BACL25 MAG-120322-bin65]|nr:MAG: GTPase Era [Microbacteriaceae bacterium BACL25 MAG-120322-bin65]HAA79385.1 GTPase Era [Microbacteriaceae bacterium]